MGNFRQRSGGCTDDPEVSDNITGVMEAATETKTVSSRVLAASEQLAEQSVDLESSVNAFLEKVRVA